jgi:hypothetical protein
MHNTGNSLANFGETFKTDRSFNIQLFLFLLSYQLKQHNNSDNRREDDENTLFWTILTISCKTC